MQMGGGQKTFRQQIVHSYCACRGMLPKILDLRIARQYLRFHLKARRMIGIAADIGNIDSFLLQSVFDVFPERILAYFAYPAYIVT